MLSIAPACRLWLCTQPTDMRRSFDGLSALVRNHNRRRTQIKVLAFEDGGYCVWSKRLEVGQFAALSVAGSVKRSLSRTEFLALLEGMDMVITRRRKRYKKVA